MRRILKLSALLAGLSPVAARSQSPAVPDPGRLQGAAAHYQAGHWREAAGVYEQLAREFPSHPLSHFRLGVSLSNLGRYREAIAPLEAAGRLGSPAPQVQWRVAVALSHLGMVDSAFVLLKAATAAGLSFFAPPVDTLRELSVLRRDARYVQFARDMDRNVRPCLYDERYREFDFWVGDWDVRPWSAPSASPFPSRNTVTLEHDGCVVIEHWVSGTSNGQSYNVFDATYGLWRQTWVDNVGGQHDFRGRRVGRTMAYEGSSPNVSGVRLPTKLTFFHIHDDTVRQLGQISPDSGKSWSTTYDLLYVKRKGQQGTPRR